MCKYIISMVSKVSKIKAMCEKRNIYKSNSETFFKFLPNDLINEIMVKSVNKEIINFDFKEDLTDGTYIGSFDFSEECGNVRHAFRLIGETPNNNKPMKEIIFGTGSWCGGLFYNYGMDVNIPEHRDYLAKILEETTNTDYPLYDNGIEINSWDLLDVWAVEGVPEYFSIYEDHNRDRGVYQEGRFRHLNRFTDMDWTYGKNGFYYRLIECETASANIVGLYRKKREAKRKFKKFMDSLTRARVYKKLNPLAVRKSNQFFRYIRCHKRDGVSEDVIDGRLWSYGEDMPSVYYSLVNGRWKDKNNMPHMGQNYKNYINPAECLIQKRLLSKWKNCLDKYEKIFWEVELGRTDFRMYQNKVYESNVRIYAFMNRVKGFRDPNAVAWRSDYRELIAGSPPLE